MFRIALLTLITALVSTPVFAAASNGLQNSMVEHSFISSDVKQLAREVVFVDTQVPDYETLISNLRDGIEVIVLDVERDSVSQIASALQHKKNISALHIITHGRDGEIFFANGNLNTDSLKNHASLLNSWSNSLTDKADILFYGCNVAEGENGQAFLREFSEITGADVAASSNITGNGQRGGDWLLEESVGDVDTQIALTEQGMLQYLDILPPDPDPSINSAHIGGDGSKLVMVYSEPLDEASVPAAGAYTVTSVALGAVTVNSVAINEFNTVTLSLVSTIAMTDTITVDYDNTFGVSHVQDLTPNLALSLTSQTVNVGTVYLGSSEWTSIAPSGGSQFDYFVDQQTGQGEGDIVGDGGLNPGFQVNFDDNGSASNTDGTLSFRFRLAEGGTNYYMTGIDADLDGAIDVFVKMDVGKKDEISIFANGGDLNISPSTSDIGVELYPAPGTNPTTVFNFNTSPVTDIDGNVVDADLDNNGSEPDYYVSGSLDFSELVTALAGLGITLTDADPLRYAVATSVNGSTFNQDIAGLPKNYDADATYVSSGAFSDPVTLDGVVTVVAGAPVINDLSGDVLSYVMNDPVSIIDQSTAATITDADDTSLDDAGALDGSLHVEIIAGADVTEDELGIDTTLVSLSTGYAVGSVVTVGVTDIGTITDIGLGTDAVNDPEISFTISFDQIAGSATLANVNALIQSVTYVNSNATTSTEGVRTVSFLVSDGAFNTQVSTSVSLTQVADITAPLAPTIDLLAASDTGDSSIDDITNDTTPTIQVIFDQTGATATDTIVGDVVKLFEGVTQVGTATIVAGDITNGYVNITSSVLTEGSLSFTATVTDAANNASAASAAQAVSLDTTIPVIVLNGSTLLTIERAGGYIEIGATASDDLDGVITANIVTVNPVNADVVGIYTVTFDVADTAGNTAAQVTRTVTVEDTTAPTVSILNQPASVNNLNAFTVTFQFDEVVSGFDSSDIVFANSTITNFVNVGGVGDAYRADIKPDGFGDVSVGVDANAAQDASSNGNTAAVTQVTTFDNTPPNVAVDPLPSINLANQSAYIVSGTCTSGDGDVLVLLSQSTIFITPYATCSAGGTWSSTFNLTFLLETNGDSTLIVKVNATQTDSAGNKGTAPIVETVKDTVKPGVQIQNVPGFVNANEFTISVVFDEDVTGFDSGDIVVTNGAVNVASFNAIDAQTYTIGVTANGAGDVILNVAANVAQDLAGNDNNAAVQVVAVFDDTAPVVIITNAAVVNAANVANYTVGGDCGNGDGDVTVSIAGATPATKDVNCTAGNWTVVFDVALIGDGLNAVTINASQTDAALNTGNATTVQVDKDVLITVPTVNVLVTNDATPVITGTADTGTSNEIVVGSATYTVIATVGNVWGLDTAVVIPDSGIFSLAGGFNEVAVTSTDAAGNSAADASTNELTLTLDDDNDGIPNAVECPSGPPFDNSCTDTDGDGTPDFQEVDSDKDGIPDAVEAGLDTNNPIDSDGDGTPDYRDTDSDNDTIDDVNEGVVDSDGDGIPDYVDVGNTGDSDGDGIPDTIECPVYPGCTNTDGDGKPDYLDTDADNDAIYDAVEAGVDPTAPIDTDGDGTPDYQDTNSDDEGADDSAEGLNDNDADGIPDYIDAASAGPAPNAGDSDGDGIADNIECELYPLCADSDSDGTPDYMETDSDNDGIPDADETGSALNDADNDGIDDTFDIDITSLINGIDQNGDGVDDTQPLDTDGDGTPDYQDTDSDGDGIDDIVECPAGIPCPDGDNDGIPDQLDVSNGDASGTDITGAGDSDGDGISDFDECTTGVRCADFDQDGLPDYMDNNPDNGPAGDPDNDAVLNYLDPDDDNDNIPDVVEDPDFDADNNPATNPLDSDLDGTPDYLDTDSDNDGLTDSDESGASGNDVDGDNIDDSYDVDLTGGVDLNTDGIDDDVRPRDTDSDSLPDYLDTVFDGASGTADTDNDGIPDDVECPVFPTNCPDSDNDGTPDFLETDSDGDGLGDNEETGSLSSGILLDTDGDGVPDYQDTDSDNDGVSDTVEGLVIDSDADGIPDALDADSSGAPFGGDSDGDGVVDMDECNTYPDCADNNNDGTPDYMDPSSRPYDPTAQINTALNGVGSNGPWILLLVPVTLLIRRKIR